MIEAPPQKYNPSEVEQKIQSFWKNNNIFKKSIESRKGSKPFVFLEGPPTANGMPHPGHVLTRVMKDLVLRYQTMHGYYIERMAGWDTHGLPVEIEVEKNLGLQDKQGIEEYGLDAFCEQCRECVFKYESVWRDLTERIGFWVDMDNPYITLDNNYIESVWWSLKQAWDKQLLYKGYKVVPYCPRCGTALSAHEVGQGYKTVEDPSIFVKFKLKEKDGFLLAWTTTPWTLLSNVALAINKEQTYVKIRSDGEILYLAEARAKVLMKPDEYEVLEELKGQDLLNWEYEPLFSYEIPEKKAWYVVAAGFVSMEDGTGIVHIAPAFGEDDYQVGMQYDLPVIQLVTMQGTFKPVVDRWAGMFVKQADPLIIEFLDERGLLAGVKKYEHEYPFCWRCDSPLLYYAMESWFIKMTAVQKTLVENNNTVDWYPDHLKSGRFGSFIGEVKDWALSRKRYWGTPLPVWTCTEKSCKHMVCVGSVEELRTLSKDEFEDYDLHRPFVDKLKLCCPKCGGMMQREPEVIDCWYDSGSAYFAQWHYPFENKEKIDSGEAFPIDFICEALDQTRGWFYSLMATSTFLFEKAPYKQVLTLGLLLDKNNQKMSKSKRNYTSPDEIVETLGADALRWYLVSANAPWMSTRFFEEAVKESLAKFLLTLWNSYNFFTTYASLDVFNPVVETAPVKERSLLDAWILSRFNGLIDAVERYVSIFEIHKAARAMESFLVDDFSNWYLRRSRKRLWVEEKTQDKLAAYSTMYEVFVGFIRLLAPFVPFISEEMYQNLRTDVMAESIHLDDYPKSAGELIDENLEAGMEKIRDLVEVGRALRSKVGIKVRIPLQKATIVCSNETENQIKDLLDLLIEEINVKQIGFARDESDFLSKAVKPNFGVLGPKFKQNAQRVAEEIKSFDPHGLYEVLMSEGQVEIVLDDEPITLTLEDFEQVSEVREYIGRAQAKESVLMLDTTLTSELEAEGLARELIRRIQSMRKELDLDVEDRIGVEVLIDEGSMAMLGEWKDHIANEVRAQRFSFVGNKPSGGLVKSWSIDDLEVEIGISK